MDYVNEFTSKNYETFANTLCTHDIYDFFRIPGYNVPIVSEPMFYNLFFMTLFGFNLDKTKERLKDLENLKLLPSFQNLSDEDIFYQKE